jgi:hypothetical protein
MNESFQIYKAGNIKCDSRLFFTYSYKQFSGSGFESGSVDLFLGLPHPDPSIIKQKSKKNIDSYCFVTSLRLFIVEK